MSLSNYSADLDYVKKDLNETAPQNTPRQQLAPMSVADWLVVLLLMSIPAVNLILMFIWAFDSTTRIEKKNYSRAMLILSAIMIGIFIIIFFLMMLVVIAAQPQGV